MTAEEIVKDRERRLHEEMCRPFYIIKPRVFKDGNAWCCLYGDNIQDGVCGFGETPQKATLAFDLAWLEG